MHEGTRPPISFSGVLVPSKKHSYIYASGENVVLPATVPFAGSARDIRSVRQSQTPAKCFQGAGIDPCKDPGQF